MQVDVRELRGICLSDDEYRAVQEELGTSPELGDLMPGTGGFRKMRWADARRGKGRRGGLRIIYYHFKSDHQIWLMTVFDKDEASDLNPKEKKALKTAIEGDLVARPLGGVDRGDHGGYADGEERHFRRVDGRRGCNEEPSRGQAYTAQLQGSCGTAPQS